MKIASIIARYLLGLMFTVFGLNGFLQFYPPAAAGESTGTAVPWLPSAHRTLPRSSSRCSSLAELLLLSGFFVPLALTLLAAELYNILAFHLTLSPGIAPALVACVLWVLVFLQYRESFNGIFSAKPATQA